MTAVSRTLFSLLLLVAPATPALAYHGVLPAGYAGLDTLFWTYDPAGGDSDSSLGLRLRGGWLANDYLGVEVQLGGGGREDDGREPSELDWLAGAYVKLMLPVSDVIHLYALGGMAHVSGTFAGDNSETGLSGGLGAEMGIVPNLAIGADYMRYADDNDITFDAVSFGLTYHF
ncbi:porin family protein [Modicisalibacter tunisiensis]|uniref:Porin family protein n=1 Tax=Modicisalibacter tunisiensis TaxID=390637 RepID=A0ABS7WW12_9GAMM|nr:porin family protein [Modicisalibacter tunisiensis]MBZ9539818.1 porin family protein [Modicisalibacter tunisiensis]MBZ9566793.1 porin family protein [Modicisalibacter tunisiensis]